MKKLFIIQPLIASYRVTPFLELCKEWNVTLISSAPDGNDGFKDSLDKFHGVANIVKSKITSFIGGRIFWQASVLNLIILERPDAIFIFANPRFLSFWIALIACKLLGIKFFSHGQGLYRKKEISLVNKIIYFFILRFSTHYLCYAPIVADSFQRAGFTSKYSVVDNSIDRNIQSVTERTACTDILFVGRLRDRSELPMLIEAVSATRKKTGYDIKLHIIGTGVMEKEWHNTYQDLKWMVWHGAEYNFENIKNISSKCLIGCYPGDAGLSIVDFMALGLVILVHDDNSLHMGPEPSYIHHNITGLRFNRKSLLSLINNLEMVYSDTKSALVMAKNSYELYRKINNPSLGEKINDCIKFNMKN